MVVKLQGSHHSIKHSLWEMRLYYIYFLKTISGGKYTVFTGEVSSVNIRRIRTRLSLSQDFIFEVKTPSCSANRDVGDLALCAQI